MSTEIDDNIVSMKFDNAAFERRMSETLKSLDQLKKSLDLTNASKGMEHVNAAAKNMNLSNIASSVEGIAGKFKALSVVGVAALATIATKAVTVGGRLASSFTIKPITEGFQEFETNMNSVQTILANTESEGTTLQQVNGALDQLNEYSDKTIYNFSQMARNVGTFTAAGVKLEDSVGAIKGIANLAAISGSNSEQASTAMYQLSQALAAGKVSLMDWNSVVNAGMGGKVFKNALFETGKALGTITDVPIGASFDEWEKKGGTFREQMQKGWITADVLKTTLGAFSGDLSQARLEAMGFGEEAAKAMVKAGKSGQAAAQDVKTFTQLVSTVKESVSSGWALTFRTVIGDFEESKKLFTSISNTIGKFVSKSAEARNKLLKTWKFFGGRKDLLDGLKAALHGVGTIIKPIVKAFREIFPPMTAQRLLDLTSSFTKFAKKIEIGWRTAYKLKNIFRGLFSIFHIVGVAIKEFVRFISNMARRFTHAGDGAFAFASRVGIMVTRLDHFLTKEKGIRHFFGKLNLFIGRTIGFFRKFDFNIDSVKDKIVGFFSNFKGVEKIGERVQQRFGMLGRAISKMGDALQWVSDKFKGVRKVMARVWEFIKKFFSNLGDSIAATMKPGDFDPAVDALNVGLLGGILLILRKMSKGFKVFFTGELGKDAKGFVGKIVNTFDELTNTLKAMQAEIKSRAIRNIAVSVGILAAAVTVLSLIDSAALTKALVAMSVSFGQLIGSMLLLEKLNFGGSGARLGALATGMILMSVAALILSAAVKNLSSLGWEELAKGLIGVAGALVAITASTQLLAADTGGMIRAGIGMIGIAIAMLILSKAVKEFAEMSWGDMAKGLVGVGVALGIVTGLMNAMPPGSILAAGVAMIPLAVGLILLQKATAAFASMSWGDMAKGMVGLAAGLAIIAVTVGAMPVTLPLIAAGLIGVAIAMRILVESIQAMGEMKLGTLAKGIGAMAAMLLILAVALNAMTGAVAGAIALGIASAALFILSKVLMELSKLSWKELGMGLAAIAGVMLVLGLAAAVLQPVIPAILGLGIAMAIVGLSFALFGVGAMLTIKALQLLAKSGIASIKMLVAALPELAYAFIKSLSKIAEDILNAAPLFVDLITKLLVKLLETIITLAPKLGEAIGAIIDMGITLITEKFPKLLTLGFTIMGKLLEGIRSHIPEYTQTIIDIVVKMLNTIANNYQRIVNAGVNLVLKLMFGISSRAGDIALAGMMILLKFIEGIANNVYRIVNTVGTIIAKFITAVSDNYQKILDAGTDAVVKFIEGLGKRATRIVNAGVDAVMKFIEGLGKQSVEIAERCMDVITDFVEGLADAIDKKAPELQEAGKHLAGAIADGMTFGLAGKIGDVANKAGGLMGGALDGMKAIGGILSPSKVTMGYGRYLAEGLAIGMDKDRTAEASAIESAERVVSALYETLQKTPDSILDMGDINPVITPVLDLTDVRAEAKNIDKIMNASPIFATASFDHAKVISTAISEQNNQTPEPVPTGPAEVTFIQNNHSPKALTANEIYKKTRSQITLAKEELGIA